MFDPLPVAERMSVAESMPGVGSFSGTHVLAEMEGIEAALLDDEAFLCRALREALSRANATICEVVSRQFEPQGVTVLALLSESHASLHTYPENGSLFADVFTCGDQADPELAVRQLAEALGSGLVQMRTVKRGNDDRAAQPNRDNGAHTGNAATFSPRRVSAKG